jgi:signal transduction histidine kinase
MSPEKQGMLIATLTIAIGYLITIISITQPGSSKPSLLQIICGVFFGIVYLILNLTADSILRRFQTPWINPLFFSTLLLTLFGIGMTLGPYGTWLMALPMVGIAVEELRTTWRWVAGIAILLVTVLPIGLRSGVWQDALNNTLTFSAAIFFVAIFTQLRLNEQNAREQSEQLTTQLEAANAQLGAYGTQVDELATTKERNRLAREIHDNLGHYLTVVNVQIEAAKTVLKKDPERALEAMTKAQELTQKGLTRVRESVASLRESPIGNKPLHEAIRTLIKDSRSTGIVTEYHVLGKPRKTKPQIELAIYRTVQEGLTNVRKHARASRMDITLDYQSADKIYLEVIDNGVGSATATGGFGLLGIRERVKLIGGDFQISTQPGQGFKLEVTILDIDERLER